MQRLGIEPSSPGLQSGAMTSLAHVAFAFEVRVVPLRKTFLIHKHNHVYMTGHVGIEPTFTGLEAVVFPLDE